MVYANIFSVEVKTRKVFQGHVRPIWSGVSPVAIINSSHSTLCPEFSVSTTHRLPSALRESFETLVLSLNLSMSENFPTYMPGGSNPIAGQIRPIFPSDDLPHGQIREIKQFRWAVCIELKVHSIRAPHATD
jgi:hypothetical protein